VGEDYILAFNVAPGYHRDDVLFSLGILRHSLNQKLREERIQGIFREARKIQASILPKRTPGLRPFDIAGRTSPWRAWAATSTTSCPLSDKILGMAIADVSGHGLPAALQTRDIYMGLRMGLGRDFKIVRTVERLNRIIHESTLTSRFVSMFYGELERHGVFIYVNAGHPPPYYLGADGEPPLDEGGTVLGPLADATYERGFVTMRPGDLLVLYTDGVTETRGRNAEARVGGVRRRAPPDGGPGPPRGAREGDHRSGLRGPRPLQPRPPGGRRPDAGGGQVSVESVGGELAGPGRRPFSGSASSPSLRTVIRSPTF
jgi:hypothetical protein